MANKKITLKGLTTMMKEGFNEIHEKFATKEEMNLKFKAVDSKFKGIDLRFKDIDSRFDEILNKIDFKFNDVLTKEDEFITILREIREE